MFRILFLAAFLFAENIGAQQLYFSGTISGFADENLLVEYPPDRFGEIWKEEIPIIDNSFSKRIDLPTSGWLKLSYKDKDRKVYVWKGADSLHISFEADFLDDELKIAGTSGNIHAFAESISEKYASRSTVKWLSEQAKDATNIDAMEMEVFRTRNEMIRKLESRKLQLPKVFVFQFKNHLGYYYYLSLFKFSSVKTSRSSIPKATEIPKVLLEGLDWERMNRASELESSFFRELLLEYVDYKALEEYDFMKFPDRNTAVQEAFNLARSNLNGEALTYFLTATLLRNAADVEPSLLRQMNVFLKQQINSQAFVSLVEKRIPERLNAKDREVPISVENETETDHNRMDLELQGLNGKTFHLSDLKGKVVYLDIWASWCGPCRKQFPAAKALKEKLSKKELKSIEFLYISIDNTETVWKKAIEELGIEGTHGLSKGGWGSEATAKFGVRSIPRYLIFDKRGKVVDGNAPRPSDPQLLGILRKLAGK